MPSFHPRAILGILALVDGRAGAGAIVAPKELILVQGATHGFAHPKARASGASTPPIPTK